MQEPLENPASTETTVSSLSEEKLTCIVSDRIVLLLGLVCVVNLFSTIEFYDPFLCFPFLVFPGGSEVIHKTNPLCPLSRGIVSAFAL
jgi:hypothetical protein